MTCIVRKSTVGFREGARWRATLVHLETALMPRLGDDADRVARARRFEEAAREHETAAEIISRVAARIAAVGDDARSRRFMSLARSHRVLAVLNRSCAGALRMT